MSFNQAVDKPPSNEVAHQTHKMQNDGSPVDVIDPEQPANLVEENKEQVAASVLLQDDQPDDDIQVLFAFNTMFEADANKYDDEDPLWIFKATSDPDTMYHYEAMKKIDADNFQDAMMKG